MEKSSTESSSDEWRNRRIVTRSTYAGAQSTRSGGVLYAKRRSDKQSVDAVIIAILLAPVMCAALSIAFISHAFSLREKKVSEVAAPVIVVTPTDMPPVGKKSILLLGSDQRIDDPGYRTDVILYITIDTEQKKVSVISFPRDLWVEPPDLYGMKINQLHAIGGFESLAGMFEDNFGIRPDYYVMTNFDNFVSIIDSLGGIDVEIGQELTDDCDLPQAVNGDCAVTPGTLHMDGATALWYVRSRHTSSDYDRMRRMQEVLYGVFKRMMSLNAITRLPELFNTYSKSVETNLKLQDILPLVPSAVKAFGDSSRIRQFAINEDSATPSWSWDGMWILLPDQEAIQAITTEAEAK